MLGKLDLDVYIYVTTPLKTVKLSCSIASPPLGIPPVKEPKGSNLTGGITP